MNLTARDIVMIMNRAAKLGVTSLTIGDLDISFSQKNRSVPKEASISQKPIQQAVSLVDDESVKAMQVAENKAEEFRKEQELFLNAPVLSPYEWEQQQANILQAGGEDDRGEIEDAEGLQV